MKTAFQPALLEWYEKEKRDLPFRRKEDPYAIWISEIMAQQTRIEALLDHYERFIAQFPDIQTLAKADLDAVMKAWQGLGYYSRARNLHKAARQCMEQYDGKLPETKSELKKLAGIGDYTAGAIASIAFHEKVSAIDGNVIRVFARLYCIKQDVTQPKVRKTIEKMVEDSLVEEKYISSYNQALMELGARVCIPGNPRCSICPVAEFCSGIHYKDVGLLPIKKAKKARSIQQKQVVVQCAYYNQEWYIHLCQRDEKGLLAGLYEFDEKFPERVYKQDFLGDYTHIFTHKEWNMKGWLVLTDWNESFLPVHIVQEQYAIPSAFMPFYTKALEIMHGKTS